MRFRVTGRDERTQNDVVRDIDCDSQDEAVAFAGFEGILVENIEPLPGPAEAPESTDISNRSPPPVSPADAARLQTADGPVEFGAGRGLGLPAPLDDPLRVLRRFVGWFMLVQIVFVVGVLVSSFTVRPHEVGTLEFTAGVILLGLPFSFAVWRLLPNRPVNAFYLRSFRHDAATAAVRRTLTAALGRGFRLSGIRDPRRRSIKVLRYLTVFLFALRYATPKYMNLEAGADWKGRLWRSLGDARCAIIDVSDLTPFVVEEIQLSYRCLGPGRLLFVGNATHDAGTWQAKVELVLNRPSAGRPIHVAVWDPSAAGRRAFVAAVRGFAAELPAEPAGPRHDALPLTRSSAALGGSPSGWGGWVWVELILGFAAAFVFWAVFNTVIEAGSEWTPPRYSGLWTIPLLGLFLCESWHFLLYLKECGTLRERCLTLGTFGFAFLWVALGVASLLPAVQKVRHAAEGTISSNNLKMIGLTMHQLAGDEERLPYAGDVPAGQLPLHLPPVSWRVRILPYLDDPDAMNASRVYNPLEPWDSPRNIRLVERMPKVYAMPGAEKKTPPGHTYYRAFVSPPATHPQAAFTRGVRTRFDDFVDGTSRTILVVEAAEAVPWTKPDDLEYDPNRPLPKLGGHFPGRFHAVLADGSVRSFRSDIPEADLRAWITRDGGEIVPDR